VNIVKEDTVNEEMKQLQSPPSASPAASPMAQRDAEASSFADILAEANGKQVRGFRWILGAGAVLLLGLGAAWGYRTVLQSRTAPIPVVTAPVKRSDISLSITESGIVELGGQQTFKAPADITVQEVRVKERQKVAAGTVLLILRDRQLQQFLQDQLVENQIDNNLLKRKREVVQEKQSKVREAQARLRDSQALLQRGFISEDDFRFDRDKYEAALSDLKNAQVDLTNAELTAQNNQIKTDSLRVRLADNQLRTPIDAVVLKVEVKPGDGVKQEGRLLTIGDPRQETVRLQLTTLNAAKVREGMPLRVSMIGPNPKVFPGRVSRVSPQAVNDAFSGGSSGGGDQAKVEAEAVLNQPSGGVLIPGSAVSVEIILDQRSNVLVVPLTAVQTGKGGSFVWVKSAEGTAEQRPVEVGLRNIQLAEIISGLQPGDKIVVQLPPDTAIAPGTPLVSRQESHSQ
jgi:HlyD family secretion protein